MAGEDNNKPGRKGMDRILWAAYYSWRGFISAVKYEAAFRQELILVFLMLPFAFWLGDGAVEHFLLIGSGLLVLIVELLNSAIEAVVDRIGMERHRLSGQAKDMGSAAVFLSLLLMTVCWLEIALF
ncbi:MAG: diacylglycerol kinase [Desulforhopalus sp.]|nr:diacylglycerol kinase [Desulforhopalus sp.]